MFCRQWMTTTTTTTKTNVLHRFGRRLSRNHIRIVNCSNTKLFSSSTVISQQRIGFIGLGNMGLPMCLNLANKVSSSSSSDIKVIGFDLNKESMSKITSQGVIPATSLKDLVVVNIENNNIDDSSSSSFSSCDVIFTMLPGCDSVNKVMSTLLEYDDDEENNRNNNKRRKIFVDCSTVNPSTSKYWSNELSKRNYLHIDAPVSGGVKGATDGTLTFMVGHTAICNEEGGESNDALKVTEPYFHMMGSKIMECGMSGTGSATKLCNNIALACQMIGISEALNLGEGLGVDPIVLSNVLNTSTAKCWSSEVNNPHPDVAALKSSPASKDYVGGFGTKLMLKDLTLAVQASEDVNVSLPLSTTCKELYKLSNLHGHGNKDFGIILQYLRGK